VKQLEQTQKELNLLVIKFVEIISEEITNNQKMQYYYDTWLMIGHRVEKQARVLRRIYSYEIMIAIISCFKDLLGNESSNDGTKIRISSIMKKMEQSGSNQPFTGVDIYNIWEVITGEKIPEIENTLMQIMTILESRYSNLRVSNIKAFMDFLYMNLMDKPARKLLGEFYTPDNIANTMVRAVRETNSEQQDIIRILDPACGTGTLLSSCIRKLRLGNLKTNHIIGIDINPLAVHLAKLIIQSELNNNLEPCIFCADALISFHINGKKSFDQLTTNTPLKLSIEFLEEKMLIIIPGKIPGKIDEMRSFIRSFVEKQNSVSLAAPEVIRERLKGPLGHYLRLLLADRICATLILNQKFDLIIGNPPYMRVQSINPMWKRTRYKVIFKSATGHFDVYVLFIELGINLLRENGRLCYISSNKFMKTTSGTRIRKFISDNTVFRFVMDFKDSHVFDATVMPIIYVLAKSGTSKSESFPYISVEKSQKRGKRLDFNSFIDRVFVKGEIDELITIDDITPVAVIKFDTMQPLQGEDPWNFLNGEEYDLIRKIKEKYSNQTLEDLAEKIFVGIKTTANYAFLNSYNMDFFRNHPQIELENKKIEEIYSKKLFLPVIRGSDVRRFSVSWKGDYIFYPHYRDRQGRTRVIPENQIPEMIEYLCSQGFKEKLSAREYIQEAGRKWYEIWNPKNPELMQSSLKIVTPDISPVNNFALDDKQFFIDGTCYIIILKEKSRLYYCYVLGVLNSHIVEFYHKCISANRLYARRYRYYSTNIKNLPIPGVSDDRVEQIAILVEKLIKDPSNTELRAELNREVYNLFEMTDSEIAKIEKWIESSYSP